MAATAVASRILLVMPGLYGRASRSDSHTGKLRPGDEHDEPERERPVKGSTPEPTDLIATRTPPAGELPCAAAPEAVAGVDPWTPLPAAVPVLPFEPFVAPVLELCDEFETDTEELFDAEVLSDELVVELVLVELLVLPELPFVFSVVPAVGELHELVE